MIYNIIAIALVLIAPVISIFAAYSTYRLHKAFRQLNQEIEKGMTEKIQHINK